MKSMEFTQASIEVAIKAIKKHSEEFEKIRAENPQLLLEDAAQKLIIDKFGDAQIEAEEIINDLKQGISKFDTLYKQNRESEKINIAKQLQEATQNCTEEERKNCFVNILTAIELLNNKDLAENDVNTKLSQNAKLTTEELLIKIEEAMNASISLDSLVANVKNGLNIDILSQLSRTIEFHKDEYRFMAALWLYIEQRENNLKLSDSDFDITTVELGALAAAAVETIIANNDMNEGKIDMTTWQKVMKWIVGAAIGVALGYVAILVVAHISIWALTLIWAIFGTGTIALIFSMVITLYVCWRVSNLVFDAWIKVLDLYTKFYNKHIASITAKISSWIASVKTWIANTTEKVKATVNSNKDTPEQTTTNNNNENNLQKQPVTA